MEIKSIHIDNNQAILLQGPTQYGFKEICNFYKQFNNVVWSTWEDEPIENLKEIEKSGIELILVKKPKFAGYLNVNFQFYSTLAGIDYIKANKKVNEIIKVRSDILIWGIERLIHRLKNKEISFMFYYNMTHPVYYLNGIYHNNMDFPCDFIIFGNIDVLHNIFNFQMEYMSEVPPEALLIRNYLISKSFVYNTNYDYIKSIGIDFFMNYEEECKLYVFWLKHMEDLGNRIKNNLPYYKWN